LRTPEREGDFEVCGEAENGQEAIEKAQLLRPAVPVIIFTAHSNPVVEKEALTSGASAVISKSDAMAVLIGKARELLDQIAA